MNLHSFSELPQQKKDIRIGFKDPAFIDFSRETILKFSKWMAE